MRARQKFNGEGVYTAIITPFKESGKVDLGALEKLVEYQIKHKVAGIVPCGITEESSTNHDEPCKVIKRVVEYVKRYDSSGKCQVIAGTGSNSTDETIELSKHAEEAGADACLVASPPYNNQTQEALYEHFKAVADAVDLPIVVCNIPSRPGVNVETDTLMELITNCDNIRAVNGAYGNAIQISDITDRAKQTGKEFYVLGGDGGINSFDLINAGGTGVVSVASNIVPGEMIAWFEAAFRGDWQMVNKLNFKLSPLFKAGSIEYALALMGTSAAYKPLGTSKLGPEDKEKVRQVLVEMGII